MSAYDRDEDGEAALRDGVLRGDERAWRVFHARHFAALYRFVHVRIGDDREAVADLVQETWMTAIKQIRRFDPARGSFEAWVFGIAGNLAKNARRRRAREVRLEEEPVAPSAGPDEASRQLALALTRLPRRYREVLDAKYESRLPVEEIAARLGTTAKAIESLLGRARAALRDQMQRREDRP